MIPVAFDGCPGWLHEGQGTTGIVLCGSFGQEAITAYRGWRDLAIRLQADGFHVLRFDYPGTGDALGDETEAGRFEAWLSSIRAGVAFLRQHTGSDDVVLVGLRLGGALALLARSGLAHVRAVACLMPVVSGRAYLREMRLLTNSWRDANFLPPAPERDGCVQWVGDRMGPDTREHLSRLDLRQLGDAPDQVLLMDADAYPDTSELARQLDRLGCRVTRLAFSGAVDWLQDTLAAWVPDEGFGRLAGWCAQFRSDGRRTAVRMSDSSPVLTQSGAFRERTVRFGPSGELAGVLCCPYPVAVLRPTVVITVNTGFGRRTGDGRVFVALSRRLAAIGVASLRMDMAGFGDSVGAEPVDPYAIARAQDIRAAIDMLERRGMKNPMLIGICSGAHAVFHAALADGRVRSLMAVNLQKFEWTATSSLKVENRRQHRPAGFYLRAVLGGRAWRRLLRGDVPVGLITALLSRPVGNRWRDVCRAVEAATGLQSAAGRTMRDVNRLAGRGTRIVLAYSEGDPGLSELSREFGPTLRRLHSVAGLELRILDGADHALLDLAARDRFIDMVVEQVSAERTAHDVGAVPSKPALHAVSVAS